MSRGGVLQGGSCRAAVNPAMIETRNGGIRCAPPALRPLVQRGVIGAGAPPGTPRPPAFGTENAADEAISKAERPIAAPATWTKQPQLMPNAAAAPPRQPICMLRPMT